MQREWGLDDENPAVSHAWMERLDAMVARYDAYVVALELACRGARLRVPAVEPLLPAVPDLLFGLMMRTDESSC